MDYMNDMLQRTSLHQIRSFILCGTEDFTTRTELYHDTLKAGCEPIRKHLEILCTDSTEREKAAAELSQALSAYEGVYMELGMKAGARLIWQLLLSDNQPPAERSGL